MRLKEAEKLEPTEVHLGFLPIFAALATTAVSTGINYLDRPPSIKPVTIPGVLAEAGIGSDIIEKINESKKKLEAVHQKEVELAKEEKALAERIAKREAIKQMITKIAPFVVVGGVALSVILLIRRKR